MSQEAVDPVNQWYLMAGGGQEYGPVTFDVLRGWAAQNRFTAGYRVSNNRQDWRAVETIPGLGMDWFVEPGDGNRYGPFHPLALLDYIREGAIPPETRVIHKTNGGEAKAYQVLLEAFVDAIDQTAEEQGELVRQAESLRQRLAERDEWFGEMSRQMQEEREQRQALEKAAARQTELEARLAGFEARETEGQARQSQLEAELKQLLRDLEIERSAHQETRYRLESELRAARSEFDRRSRGFEDHLKQLAENTVAEKRETDHRASQAKAEIETLRQALDKDSRRNRDLELRLEQEETRKARAAADASRAEQALREELAALKAAVKAGDAGGQQARAATEAASRAEAERNVLRRENGELRKRLEEAESQNKALRSGNESAHHRETAAAREAAAQTAVLREEARRLTEERDQAAGRSAEREAQAGRLEKQAAELARQVEENTRETAAVRLELQSEQGRIRELQSLIEERETAARREADNLSGRWAGAVRDLEAERAAGARLRERADDAERALLQANDRLGELRRELDDIRRAAPVLSADGPPRNRDAANEPRRRKGADGGGRPGWAAGPVEDVPDGTERPPEVRPDAEPARPGSGAFRAPPPRKPGVLAGLEAQAQAELKAWQEKKQQAQPKTEPAPPKNKSWLPWKQS